MNSQVWGFTTQNQAVSPTPLPTGGSGDGGGGGGAGSLSNSGGGTWQYSRDITITNPGAALTDYQVLVNLTGSNFPTNAQTSGADIRFTDAGGAELSYWIENWDYANRSGRVWVNVTSVPSGSAMMRMWYGNPIATSSNNGITTFDFFDDFSGDLSKWEFQHPADWVKTTDNTIKHTTTTVSIARHFFPNSDLILEGRVKTPSAADQYTHLFLRKDNIFTDNGNDLGFGIGVRTSLFSLWKGNGWVLSGSPSNIQTNTWYAIKGVFHGANVEVYADPNQASATTLRLSTNSASITSGSYIGLISAHIANNEWDDVRVRKYASPEPSVSVGAETLALNDIEAKITNIWGSNYPILLFGQNAALGQVISVDLDSSPISEPLPVYTVCIGPRNSDKSVISRFKISDTKVRIVVNITGGKGFNPGSEGYIKIVNPDWRITEILPGSTLDMNRDYYGTGITIDRANGLISWSGRGGSTAAACNENEVNMQFIVEKATVTPTTTPTPTPAPTPTPTPTATPSVISAGSVTRSISTSAVQPGDSIDITLTPSPSTIFDTPGYRVIETIPQGFTFVNTSVGYTHQGNVYNFHRSSVKPTIPP